MRAKKEIVEIIRKRYKKVSSRYIPYEHLNFDLKRKLENDSEASKILKYYKDSYLYEGGEEELRFLMRECGITER